MLKLIKAEIESFLSFQDSQTINYNDKGLNFIQGINLDKPSKDDLVHSVGSGKTTLTFIPQYAFYGIINKKISKDRIVNKTIGKNSKVVLEFATDNVYKIERYRKHSEHKNKLYLFEKQGDEWIDKSSNDNDATQEEINKIIGLNYLTFQRSVLISRDDKNQFLELETRDRGKIFENFVQLNKLIDFLKKAQKDYKQNSEVYNLKSKELVSLNSVIHRDREYIEEIKEKYENKKEDLVDKLDRIEEEISIVTQSEKPLEELITDINTYRLLLKENKFIEEKKLHLIKKMQSANNLITKYIAYKDKYELDIKRIADNIKKIKPITCIECGAIQNKKTVKEEKDKLTKSKKEFEDALAENEKDKIKEIDELKKDTKSLKLEEQNLAKNLSEITKLNLPEALMSEIEKESDIIDKIKNLNTEHDRVTHELKVLSIKNDVNELIEKIKTNVGAYKTLKESSLEIKRRMNALEFWISILDFKNENSIKQFILSKIIPVFNNVLQNIMNTIYNGELIIVFDNLFDETILYQDQDFSYEELSTGEQAKLNIAINLAILDMTQINFGGTNNLWLDEVFTNLDQPSIINIINLIQTKYTSEMCVNIITHQSEVINNMTFDTTTKVLKENNCSRIEIEQGV